MPKKNNKGIDMQFLSNNMKNIPPSKTMAMTDKARKLIASGEDVIDLSSGEPDFDTVSTASEAGMKAIQAGVTKYTTGDGTAELKQTIQEKFARDNSLSYELNQISVGAGAKQVMYNALAATLNPKDEVIIPTPYWVSYPVMVSMCGGTPVFADCFAENDFVLTAQELAKRITANTKWLILNYPNNPSGALASKEELEALAEVLRQHPNVNIITDDIYELLIFSDTKFHTLAEVAPDLYDRVLTVNGMSKGYAMTGWRIGYAAGRADLIKAMSKIQSQITANPSSIGQAAATQALKAKPTHAQSWCDTFRKRRDMIVSAMNAIDGVTCETPMGAFYAFPNVGELLGRTTADGVLISNTDELAEYWLDEAKVAVVPGIAFGAPQNLRISYAAKTEHVEEAAARIKMACEKLRP
jgi:aspartate aminotransferase